jgi:hypothetical protein
MTMTLEIGDLLELSVRQTLLGEQCFNIYQYVCSGLVGDVHLLNFLQEVRDTMIPEQVALQSQDVNVDELRAENLSNGLDFSVLGVDIDGTIAVPSMPSATAAAFKLEVATRETRPGSKRLCGLSEDDVTGNLWAPAAPDLTAYLAQLESWIVAEGDDPPDNATFIMQIIGRDPITKQYDLDRRQHVSNVSVRGTVTTQTSRRAGRGI